VARVSDARRVNSQARGHLFLKSEGISWPIRGSAAPARLEPQGCRTMQQVLSAWDAVLHHTAFATIDDWFLCLVTAVVVLVVAVGVRKLATVP
jgi:hypothetical protein